MEYWGDEPWLQLNNVYSYGPVYASTLEQYDRPEGRPLFLIESAYENEHGATERRLRTQAYHAVLSGASGQVFGNNPIWHFDGGGLYPAPVTWQEALDSQGAKSMTHLRNLMTGVRWWDLKPDVHSTLLTGGLGSDEDRAVAARSADRSFALLYLPSARDIVVDLEQLAGPQIVARWYDPASGRRSEISGSPFEATGLHRFRPEPDANDSGFDDWVLILKSHSMASAQIQAGSDALIRRLQRLGGHLRSAVALAARPRAIRLAVPLVIALMGSMLDTKAAASAPTDARGSPETSPAAELQRANGASASGRTGAASTFPVAVRPGQRYLVDAAGKPFFINGDAAWSLIAGLTREEADFYLDDRRARGFNTILVSLIETRFAVNAPANAYGELPFHNKPFETSPPSPPSSLSKRSGSTARSPRPSSPITARPTKITSPMPIGCCVGQKRRASWCC